MAEHDWLAERFEENRPRLRAVAYRMLGSSAEAEDAVQEAWLRLSRSDADAVENLGGWLTTVVARVCLDMLRSRAPGASSRSTRTSPDPSSAARRDRPEHEAVLADSVGLALLVVLETLTPAERLAFVLHDMFAVPFDEIADDRRSLPGRHAPAREPGAPPGRGQGAARSADADARQRRGRRCVPRRRPRTATSGAASRCSTRTSCSGWTPRRCRPAAVWCSVAVRPWPTEPWRRPPGPGPPRLPSSTGPSAW